MVLPNTAAASIMYVHGSWLCEVTCFFNCMIHDFANVCYLHVFFFRMCDIFNFHSVENAYVAVRDIRLSDLARNTDKILH